MGYSLSCIQEEIHEDAIFVIGAGHFGKKAARLFSRESDARLYIIDVDKDSLSELDRLPIKKIPYDGIEFLLNNFHLLKPGNTIVPAIPVHLVYEWVKRYTEEDLTVKKAEMPEALNDILPHVWPGQEGSLLVSYADYICPDDCPEPDFCTVTGERRDRPLHELIGRIDLPDYKIRVIVSRQIAPGLGGYRVADLIEIAEEIKKNKMGNWLLSTACRCHGIITAMEVI